MPVHGGRQWAAPTVGGLMPPGMQLCNLPCMPAVAQLLSRLWHCACSASPHLAGAAAVGHAVLLDLNRRPAHLRPNKQGVVAGL